MSACPGVDLATAEGDDDLIALCVEGFGKRAADAGAAAGNQNGVAGNIHLGKSSQDSPMLALQGKLSSQ
jgi:hypothetical protein